MQVYSADDYARLKSGETVRQKELFYIPTGKQQALRVEEIAKQDFYLGFWDLQSDLPDTYPTHAKDFDSELSFWDGSTACLLYNPKYGGGYRDQNGMLNLRYPDGQIKKRITSSFFKSYGYTGRPGIYRDNISISFGLINFFQERCPELLSYRLVRPENDLQLPIAKTDKGSYASRIIQSNGSVMISGDHYYIGKEYIGNRVYRISDKLAAVVRLKTNRDIEIMRFFTLVSPDEEVGKTMVSKGYQYRRFRKGDFSSFAPDEVASQVGDISSDAEYFTNFIRLARRISSESKFILPEFSPRERKEAVNLYLSYRNNSRFWEFLKNYQTDGLRSLMGISDITPTIFELGVQLDHSILKNILREAGLITKMVFESPAEKGSVNEILARRLLDEAVLEQMKRVVLASVPLAKGEKLSYGYADIIDILRTLREKVYLQYSHLDRGEHDELFRQTVNLLAHPDPNVREIVLGLYQRSLQYEIKLVAEKARELFNPPQLELSQKEAYSDSDLRKWERRTADTYQSLRHILLRFKERKEPVKYILDIGTGEGRIAGMLARLGYKVIGLDISAEQLQRGKERVIQEGQGLREEKQTEGLSYNALLKLQEEGLLPRTPILDDEETAKNYIQVQGSFFNIADALSKAGINLKFDSVIVTWHTYDEFGPPKSQEAILDQIWSLLNNDGELIKEIPNRKQEPYATVLQNYHISHPIEPYGTIRDSKPAGEEEGLYPPRYFPDINELILLLKSKGFDIDLKKDIQTYLIEDREIPESERGPAFEEYFVIARKPTT